ncbi:MAG: 3',5'-cyclic adenosine monophosphate phosphodiesterase CpdA [Chlamydiae bacterium]|nr:3',5'-cyclic adenosine monophosphate phosphodiesterase CpdA [Chlamydiota bacterium]
MKIAHLSDIHFFRNDLGLCSFFSKRLLGTLNHYLNPKRHSINFDLFDLPKFLKKEGVTHVIITGDFTTTSSIKEFALAKEFIKSLKDLGFSVFSIPGNHDKYTRDSEKKKRFYKFIESPQALEKDGLACEDLGEGYKCIMLDTALATPLWSSQGSFSKDLENKLEELLSTFPLSQPLILVNHFPVIKGDSPARHQMLRKEALKSLIKRHPNIILFLHGHTHTSEFTSTNPLMINCGSLTLTENGSFHIMDLTEGFLEVKAYHFQDEHWEVRAHKTFPTTKNSLR